MLLANRSVKQMLKASIYVSNAEEEIKQVLIDLRHETFVKQAA